MKRSRDTDERDMPNRADEQPTDASAEEREIDSILADSFPASDAPPWTLGVAHEPTKGDRRRKNRGRQ